MLQTIKSKQSTNAYNKETTNMKKIVMKNAQKHLVQKATRYEGDL